jgi:hypothetical protein
MPDANLASEADVSLTIPAGFQSRFRREVMGDLAFAADNVAEGVRWQRDRRDPGRLDDDDLPRLRAAERVYEQVRRARGDELLVRAPRRVLLGLLRAAVLTAADELGSEVEDRGWATAEVRTRLREFESGLDALDRLTADERGAA